MVTQSFILAKPPIQVVTSKDFFNVWKNNSQYFTNLHNISCLDLFFIVYCLYLFNKRMWLHLPTDLPMFVYIFQCIWRNRPLKAYSVFESVLYHWENCMHFVHAPRCVHPTALMHLKKWIFRKWIQLHSIFLALTRMGSHWELLLKFTLSHRS